MNLRTIDDATIDTTQTASDWVHSYTGLDCLLQARVLMVATSVLWILRIAAHQAEKHNFDWAAGLVLLSQVHEIFFGSHNDIAARTNARTGTRNPRRINPIYFSFRLLFLCVMIVFWVISILAVSTNYHDDRKRDFGINLLFSITWVQQLLQACDVQTPREGKIREALQAIGFARRRLTPTG